MNRSRVDSVICSFQFQQRKKAEVLHILQALIILKVDLIYPLQMKQKPDRKTQHLMV